MGHLFLINDSFEIENIPESKRDKIFRDFCDAVENAMKSKDSFHGLPEIHNREYSYGTFYYDFLFQGWPVVNQNPALKGISSTTLNLYHSLVFAIPGLVSLLPSDSIFLDQFQYLHYGYSGFAMPSCPNPYVSCYSSWFEWKRLWLSQHQVEIVWKNGDDDFLPNKTLSDEILWKEVISHGMEDKLPKYKGNRTITFYEEVMKKKGPNTEAYTIEVGKKVAEANYYIYLPVLSRNERDAVKSLRTIFRLIGRNGSPQYISLDHKHGMFEYHNERGDHRGEFKFDGSYNSEAQNSHNFRTLESKGE
ncbi:MAG: hypothetical protein J0I32_04835 [Sphingobacteriales bacterium]|nr:hypothetical protein [Sphingobacteriales bacterium]OJV98485.1 MAG: hypothetical protein BGO52_11920 [Sphingobacteriales bacterium 44-61]